MSPDFHDMKLELIARAKAARPLDREQAKTFVKSAMAEARKRHPEIIWGDFSGRLFAAVSP